MISSASPFLLASGKDKKHGRGPKNYQTLSRLSTALPRIQKISAVLQKYFIFHEIFLQKLK
jgi:hypothetical protein